MSHDLSRQKKKFDRIKSNQIYLAYVLCEVYIFVKRISDILKN